MNWKLLNRIWHANLGMASLLTLGAIALSCPFIAHKSDFAPGKALMDIHYGKFLPPDLRWLWIDSQGLILGLLIVSGFLMHRKAVKKAANVAADDPAVAGSSVTVLDLADTPSVAALSVEGEKRGLRIFRCTSAGLSSLTLAHERWLIVPQPLDQAQLASRLAKEKPGSLKRLEVAIEPGEQSEAIATAFSSAGAKIMRLPDQDGAWSERVLAHLCAQSSALKPRPKAAPTKAASAAAAPAFTLLEMLVSIAIVGGLIAITSGALTRMAQGDRIRTAALEFTALVREARSLAMREGTWVRLAFLPDGREHTLLGRGEPEQPRMGCALYVLRRPALSAPSAMVIRPTAGIETATNLVEVVSTSRVPLPRSLLAGWDFAPGHQRWVLWDHSVKLRSALFGDFMGEAAAEAPATFLWQPARVWDEEQLSHLDVPPDHDLTPVRGVRRIVSDPFDASVTVPLPQGKSTTASAIWGDQPVPHWSEDEAAGAVFLPALDFQPDGALACAPLRDRVRFDFTHRFNPNQPAVRVVLDTRTAEAHIE